MHSLTQILLTQRETGPIAFEREVSRFSPADIRLVIADLVRRERLDLANSLADAGLSLYPQSEDILAISALLAECQGDWNNAQALLEQLIEVQGKTTTPQAWFHLIRVQRCHFEPAQALRSAEKAVLLHPEDTNLSQELHAVRELVTSTNVFATPALAH